MQAVHVLNVVTVPVGAQMGTDSGAGEGRGDTAVPVASPQRSAPHTALTTNAACGPPLE